MLFVSYNFYFSWHHTYIAPSVLHVIIDKRLPVESGIVADVSNGIPCIAFEHVIHLVLQAVVVVLRKLDTIICHPLRVFSQDADFGVLEVDGQVLVVCIESVYMVG
jgi:hypothetical protein